MRNANLCLVLVTVYVSATVAPERAMAQRSNAISIAGGLTPIVQSVRSFRYRTGLNAQISMDLARVLGRVGVRADVFVHSLVRDPAGSDLSRRTSIPGAAASFTVPLARVEALFQPYLVAGAGTYRTDRGGGGPEWHFGFGGGAGMQVGRGQVRTFIEGRWLNIADGGTPRAVPIMIGMRF